MSENLEPSKSDTLRHCNRAELSEYFGVSLVTIDAWVRRGCPYVDRGSRGRPWTFDLAAVVRWREDQARQEGAQRGSPDVDPLAEHFLDRLRGWEDIPSRSKKPGPLGKPVDIATCAEFLRASPGDVLTWLRVGAPYAKVGNWRTGNGFQVIPLHVLDFALLLGRVAAQSPAVTAAHIEELGLNSFVPT